MAAYNKSLARFDLTDIPAAPAGKPQIEVGFEIDINGIVSVEATDQGTGRRQAMTIHPFGGLGLEELQRLVEEAHARRAQVEAEKDRADSRRRIEGLAANLTRSVQVLESELRDDEADAILAALAGARRALALGTPEALESSLGALQLAAQIAGRAMLRR
jgi:molecular chaperone DnaK